ncbi:MAG: ABC transporter ATP-binding protein [Patescibacteria group bacterium]
MRDFIRYVIRLLAPYKAIVLWCSFLALLAAGMSMIGPTVLGRAIDGTQKSGALTAILIGVGGWLVLEYAAETFRTYLGRRGTIIAHDAISQYRLRTVDILLRKPLSFHYGQRNADLTQKLSSFEQETLYVITGIIFYLFPALLTVMAMLGYLAFLDWRISLLLGLSVAGLVFYKYKTLPEAMRSQFAWRAADREVSSVAWDAIRNILVVKSTTTEDVIGARLKANRGKFVEAVSYDARLDERMYNRQNLITRSGSALVLLVALLNVMNGAFTVGQFTAVAAYTMGIFGHVQFVQWQLRNLTRASATHIELEGLLEAEPEDYESGETLDLKGSLEFRNVQFRYRDDVPVLEDVSFRTEPGERIAVVGESGEGKTTLIDLIGRYHLPQDGAILYDGVDAKDVNLRSLRSQIGLVPQDLPLLHESLGENIRFGRPGATDEEMREAAKLARLDSFIEGLPDKYATVVGERGLKLSGGQRQRVALARAFIRNPKILILDEPTSNLDSKTEEEIQRSLEMLMKGRTTFIIAHRLRTVRDANRILVLKGGRIVEQGRHGELVAKNGAYASLLRSQTGLVAADEVKEEGKTSA